MYGASMACCCTLDALWDMVARPEQTSTVVGYPQKGTAMMILGWVALALAMILWLVVCGEGGVIPL
jgi:hypothetical protein